MSPKSKAVWIPHTPPPITNALLSTATLVASNGSSNLALATAIRVKSLAFSVAASGSAMCTQESCSLKFANSNKNLFKPASSTHLRKVGSWRRGEHAATTTLLRLCSLISSWIINWPGSEHMYL